MPALREEAIVPGNLKAWMELCAWLLLAAGATLLATLGILSEEGCIWVATILLLGIFLAAWRGFEGGRHPCFLFLGMLLVFQCGRLIAHILGALPNPMQIEAAASVPIGISTDAAEVTLLMLVLSAICVYAPCRLAYRAIIFGAGNEDRWLPALYLLILLTFPLAFYKNWAYFSYIRAQGGYLAVFTDNAGILQSAGTFIRSIALVNNAALLTAFVFERRPRRIFWILMLYFALSTLDLLIGFRGKFFSQALVLWFIQKLKAGGRFKLVPPIGIGGCRLCRGSGGCRIPTGPQCIQMLSPIAFLGQQGVSLNVTDAAVAFHDKFARFGFNYLWGGFVYGIVPPPAVVQHHMWTNDLEDFLNPVRARLNWAMGPPQPISPNSFYWAAFLPSC